MSRYTIILIPVLILIAGINTVQAQFKTPDQPTFAEYLAGNGDDETDAYYAAQVKDTTIKYQNPTVALFKSMFVPGLGQIGNHKYIKAGVIIVLETSLIATLVHYTDKASSAKHDFETETDQTLKTSLFKDYKVAKDDRNRFSWYTATVVFLSMFDAYVDAHLAGFPKYDKKVSVDMTSEKELDLALKFTYRF